MSVKRHYGDDGQLLRYELSKEMKQRAARYYKKQKRAQLIDAIAPYIIIIVAVSLMTAYYLIMN
jgi:hypothetical protein